MDTTIETLGEPRIDSPLHEGQHVEETERVLFDLSADALEKQIKEGASPVSFLKAGPRRRIYFDPSKLKCAIVTCGGLCPGLNNVIRSLVLTLHHTYHVRNIIGIRYGLQGFIPKFGHPVLQLSPEEVSEINEVGGTILSSSRGPQDIGEIVDSLERMNVGILFTIGGDGSFRAGPESRKKFAIETRR